MGRQHRHDITALRAIMTQSISSMTYKRFINHLHKAIWVPTPTRSNQYSYQPPNRVTDDAPSSHGCHEISEKHTKY
jgi:hypothetical protein